MTKCPCPCCGFYIGEETFYGCHNICEICGWQDDHVQLANPACRGGANGDSFIEVQKRLLYKVPVGISEYNGKRRDGKWRTLRSTEITNAEHEATLKPWMNKGIDSYSESYWIVNLDTGVYK